MDRQKKTALSRLKPSPELREMLSSRPAEEKEALKEAIKQNGPLQPIHADQDGNIIDGHDLYDIYVELKLNECWVITHQVNKDEKRLLAISLNFNRRGVQHRRELIAAELKREAKSKRKPWSARRWATVFGCSHNTVQKVIDDLESNGQLDRCPREAKDKRVFEPKTSVVAPLRQIKAVQEDLQELKKGPKRLLTPKSLRSSISDQRRIKAAEEGAKLPVEDEFEMLVGDFRKLPVEEKSAALVLTDPPYDRESLPLWADLGEWAKSVLKPNGFLVAWSGHAHLPSVIRMLEEHLKWVWMVTIQNTRITGTTPMPNVHISGMTRPVLIFCNGDHSEAVRTFADFKKGGGREKALHDWQQSLDDFRFIVEVLSSRGDLVADPMAGSFTTAHACKLTGRRFWGCDLGQDNVNIGKQRLSEVTPMLDVPKKD